MPWFEIHLLTLTFKKRRREGEKRIRQANKRDTLLINNHKKRYNFIYFNITSTFVYLLPTKRPPTKKTTILIYRTKIKQEPENVTCNHAQV